MADESPRVLRLADRIKVIIAETLERRVKDPRLGFVTVTDVKLTKDLRDATIYYTVLGDDADLESTAEALESAKGMLRTEVGRATKLRFAPTLTFRADAIPANARLIEELIADARKSDEAVSSQAAGAQFAGDADPYRHDAPDESTT